MISRDTRGLLPPAGTSIRRHPSSRTSFPAVYCSPLSVPRGALCRGKATVAARSWLGWGVTCPGKSSVGRWFVGPGSGAACLRRQVL